MLLATTSSTLVRIRSDYTSEPTVVSLSPRVSSFPRVFLNEEEAERIIRGVVGRNWAAVRWGRSDYPVDASRWRDFISEVKGRL